MRSRHALLCLTLLLPALAGAQDIWRCGPDGRSYSATPCAEGRKLDAPEARPAADVAAARTQAAREVAQAEAARTARLREEAALRGNGLAGFAEKAPAVKPTPARPAHHRPKQAHRASEDDGIWRATAPGSRRRPG